VAKTIFLRGVIPALFKTSAGSHVNSESVSTTASTGGTSAEFWLNLQTLYDLRIAEQKAGKAIKSLPKLQGTGRQLRELR